MEICEAFSQVLLPNTIESRNRFIPCSLIKSNLVFNITLPFTFYTCVPLDLLLQFSIHIQFNILTCDHNRSSINRTNKILLFNKLLLFPATVTLVQHSFTSAAKHFPFHQNFNSFALTMSRRQHTSSCLFSSFISLFIPLFCCHTSLQTRIFI